MHGENAPRRLSRDGVALRVYGEPGRPGILLWPGLGFTGAYFAGVVDALPGRCVVVDPPGWGGSPPLERYERGRLLDLAVAVFESSRCVAVVGHSLGADLAVALANARPDGLRAVVLLDGGFEDDASRAARNEPAHPSREELLSLTRDDELRFPDLDAAVAHLSAALGADPAVVAPVLREIFDTASGEARPTAPPERGVDLFLALRSHDAPALAARLDVPTLLVAAGRVPAAGAAAGSSQPPDVRAAKRAAWEAFASASPLVDVHVAEDWHHHLVLQAPDEVGRLVGGWLQRHV